MSRYKNPNPRGGRALSSRRLVQRRCDAFPPVLPVFLSPDGRNQTLSHVVSLEAYHRQTASVLYPRPH